MVKTYPSSWKAGPAASLSFVDKVTAAACRRAGADPGDPATWGRRLRLRGWYATLAEMAGWKVAAAAPPAAAAMEEMPVPPAPAETHGGGDRGKVPAPRSALEAAVLAVVRRSPDLGERALARALAAEGATPGRVHRILERHGLLTAERRLRWPEAAGEAAPGGSAGPAVEGPTEARLPGRLALTPTPPPATP